MIRRADTTVSDSLGTPEPGVYITVKRDTGALATIYDDSGGFMANPFLSGIGGAFAYNISDTDAGVYTEEFRLSLAASPRKIQTIDLSLNSVAVRYALTRAAMAAMTTTLPVRLIEAGREGDFVWSSTNFFTLFGASLATIDPNQALYIAPATAPTGASGAWVRKFTGPHNVKWFGAVGDGTTDDSAAFVAAIAYLKATGNAWQLHGYQGPGAGRLFIPKGIYNLGSTTLDITATMIIEGEGVGGEGAGVTVLTWTSNVTGIRIQDSTTSGASTSGLSNLFAGSATILRNFSMDGAFTTTESEAHAIHLRQRATIENVFIDRFAGDGIHIEAQAPANGNANNWKVINCTLQRCRNGLMIDGPDANAGYSIGLSVVLNRRWGIFDSSFLGNTHIQPHSAGNGKAGYGDGTATPVTLVHLGGRLFTPVHGQEATAAITSPPASASDTAYWLYYGAGTVTASTPAWVSGVNIRSGGAYCSDENAANTRFENAYSESDGPPAQMFGSANLKGLQGAGNPGGNGHYEWNGSATKNVGYSRGAAADYSFNINSTNFSYLNFYNFAAFVPTKVGYISGFTGGYMAFGFVTELDYVRNGVTISYWDANGLNLLANYSINLAAGTGVYKYGGNQVVGARKTGWAVDTGTAKRTANTTYAAGTTLTYSAAYVQAEQTAMATRMAAVEAALQNAMQTIKALKDDLHGTAGHGLIGT